MSKLYTFYEDRKERWSMSECYCLLELYFGKYSLPQDFHTKILIYYTPVKF